MSSQRLVDGDTRSQEEKLAQLSEVRITMRSLEQQREWALSLAEAWKQAAKAEQRFREHLEHCRDH